MAEKGSKLPPELQPKLAALNRAIFMRESKAAALQYRDLLEARPDFKLRGPVQYDLARLLELGGELELSLKAYRTIIESQPENAAITPAYKAAGHIAYRLDRFDEALDYLEHFLESDPLPSERQDAEEILSRLPPTATKRSSYPDPLRELPSVAKPEKKESPGRRKPPSTESKPILFEWEVDRGGVQNLGADQSGIIWTTDQPAKINEKRSSGELSGKTTEPEESFVQDEKEDSAVKVPGLFDQSGEVPGSPEANSAEDDQSSIIPDISQPAELPAPDILKTPATPVPVPKTTQPEFDETPFPENEPRSHRFESDAPASLTKPDQRAALPPPHKGNTPPAPEKEKMEAPSPWPQTPSAKSKPPREPVPAAPPEELAGAPETPNPAVAPPVAPAPLKLPQGASLSIPEHESPEERFTRLRDAQFALLLPFGKRIHLDAVADFISKNEGINEGEAKKRVLTRKGILYDFLVLEEVLLMYPLVKNCRQRLAFHSIHRDLRPYEMYDILAGEALDPGLKIVTDKAAKRLRWENVMIISCGIVAGKLSVNLFGSWPVKEYRFRQTTFNYQAFSPTGIRNFRDGLHEFLSLLADRAPQAVQSHTVSNFLKGKTPAPQVFTTEREYRYYNLWLLFSQFGEWVNVDELMEMNQVASNW